MIEFEYNILHIPTGEKYVRKVLFPDRLSLLTAISYWNRLGAGVWQYWD
jgi:hypothetical protein